MNYLKFLGTAGARFVMISQLRASGGLWLSLFEQDILIDPGPGSLVKALSSRPRLDPRKLTAIILTHRHLDHSGDLNVMIEAMTQGGYRKRGLVFAPQDALEGDPVILKYLRDYPEKIEILKAGGTYQTGKISFQTPLLLEHGVENYGLNFLNLKGEIFLSLISDTLFFAKLPPAFPGKVLILHTVLTEEKSHPIQHLKLTDLPAFFNPPRELTILTHFGMGMLKEKPHQLTEKLSAQYRQKIIAARDGMTVNLDAYLD